MVATLVQISILTLLVEYAAINKIVASGVGFCMAIFVNYYLQYSFVFSSTFKHTKAFPRYVLSTLCMLIVNIFLFKLGISMLSSHYQLVQIAVIGMIAMLNFVINAKFTFKR